VNLYDCRYKGIDFDGIALVRAETEEAALEVLGASLVGSGCELGDRARAEIVNLPENEVLVIWDGAY
jgi:hypothetical protein